MTLKSEATDRNIKVADGKTSETRLVIRNVSFSFAVKAASLDFLVFEKMLVDIIIGSPTSESLEARLYREHNFVTVKIDGSVVQLVF